MRLVSVETALIVLPYVCRRHQSRAVVVVLSETTLVALPYAYRLHQTHAVVVVHAKATLIIAPYVWEPGARSDPGPREGDYSRNTVRMPRK